MFGCFETNETTQYCLQGEGPIFFSHTVHSVRSMILVGDLFNEIHLFHSSRGRNALI